MTSSPPRPGPAPPALVCAETKADACPQATPLKSQISRFRWNWDELPFIPVTATQNLVSRPRRGFTRDQTLRGAKAAAVARTRKAAERRRRAYEVHEVMDGLDRSDVSAVALAAMVEIGFAILENGVPPPTTARDVLDLVRAAETMYYIYRLEDDAATFIAQHGQLMARMKAIDAG